MKTKKVNVLLLLVISISLVACGASVAELNEQATAIADSIFTTQTAQASSYPSTPTIPPATTLNCPEATVGTLLLKDEDGSYCLLYPEGHGVVIPFAGEVCLVPGEPPYMACHSASLIINVEEADGRTADEVADTVTVENRCSGERYNLTIADENAVVLPECGGQATSRNVFIVHDDRLYNLTFLDLSERFYAQVITSFMFLR